MFSSLTFVGFTLDKFKIDTCKLPGGRHGYKKYSGNEPDETFPILVSMSSFACRLSTEGRGDVMCGDMRHSFWHLLAQPQKERENGASSQDTWTRWEAVHECHSFDPVRWMHFQPVGNGCRKWRKLLIVKSYNFNIVCNKFIRNSPAVGIVPSKYNNFWRNGKIKRIRLHTPDSRWFPNELVQITSKAFWSEGGLHCWARGEKNFRFVSVYQGEP